MMFYLGKTSKRVFLVVVLLLLLFGAQLLKAGESEVVGDWHGSLDTGTAKLRLVFHFIESPDAGLSGSMDSLDQGAMGIPFDSVVFNQGKLIARSGKISGRYEAELKDGVLSGTWFQGGGKMKLVLKQGKPQLSQFSPDLIAKLQGDWLGVLKVSGIELRLAFRFFKDKNGNDVAMMDSLDQGANDILVGEISGDTTAFVITVPSVGGSYTGRLEDGRMLGTWKQGAGKMPLKLDRVKQVPQVNRPQTPKAPFPYSINEVVFTNVGAGIELAGTLTIPGNGSGPFPAVILISGSGPQDRDESILGHKPFWVIADNFSRNGIAVLRYDDRGTAASGGIFSAATSADFATDTDAAVRYLLQRKDIDHTKIGLQGHSEGGLIAPMVAGANSNVSFLVLMAGTGLVGKDILDLQSELISKVQGVSPELRKLNHDSSQELYAIIENEADNDKAAVQVEVLFRRIWAGMSPEMQAEAAKTMSLDQAISMTNTQMLTPWFRYFLAYDPVPALEALSVPVLALNGSNDLQVPSAENLAAIWAALEKSQSEVVEVVELDGLNHLFQTSETGNPAEYAKIEETFSPQALKLMREWILAR